LIDSTVINVELFSLVAVFKKRLFHLHVPFAIIAVFR